MDFKHNWRNPDTLPVNPSENRKKLEGLVNKKKALLKVVNLNMLPDKGLRMKEDIENLMKQIELLKVEDGKVTAPENLVEEEPLQEKPTPDQSELASETLTKKCMARNLKLHVVPLVSPSVLPNRQLQQLHPSRFRSKGFSVGGKLEVVPILNDCLDRLRSCMEERPAPEMEEPDPPGLITQLMPHQKRALTWMIWRENQTSPGGIFADEMGLGKTLCLIALMLKDAGSEKNNLVLDGSKSLGGGTLVICPASLLNQWKKEVELHCHKGSLKILVYHGKRHEISAKKLASFHVVLSSYGVVQKEMSIGQSPKGQKSPLQLIRWDRLVLDEAHFIRNYKTSTAKAICCLSSSKCWALTGTPVHNNLKDLYSLIRFLKFHPLDDYAIWKKFVDSENNKEHLSLLTGCILLRRTKNERDLDGKPLIVLPQKQTKFHWVNLSEKELEVYQIFMKRSRALLLDTSSGCHSQLLPLLLRMQQCCNHLGLLNPLLNGEEMIADDVEMLISQIEGINLKEKEDRAQDVKTSSNDEDSIHKVKGQKVFVATENTSEGSHIREKKTEKEGLGTKELENRKKTPDDPELKKQTEKVITDDFDDLILTMKGMTISRKGGEPGPNICSELQMETKTPASGQAGHPSFIEEKATVPLAKEGLKDVINRGTENVTAKIMDPIDLSFYKDDTDFELEASSTKVTQAMELILHILSHHNKCVVVSQWTSMLKILSKQLDKAKVPYRSIQGEVSLEERASAVELFNTDLSTAKVMLLSLKAGGVGLNLIGANHLLLLDAHWNPALEQQASDRIHRVGQTKDVTIHRFLCRGTIEEKILHLQESKIRMASNVLASGKIMAKDFKALLL